jgi:hypothetical protein
MAERSVGRRAARRRSIEVGDLTAEQRRAVREVLKAELKARKSP